MAKAAAKVVGLCFSSARQNRRSAPRARPLRASGGENERGGTMVLWETETREEAKMKKTRTEPTAIDRHPRNGVMLRWLPDE
ncbi:hypothetical protein [Roseovarius lutimaris]|nr:hypothetical protein [Roseovarius lutimaris]